VCRWRGEVCGLKPFPRAWQESVRAEALSEGVEAPAGLGCVGGVECGLKPSLRAWKPLRGWGVWVEGRGVRAEALPESVAGRCAG